MTLIERDIYVKIIFLWEDAIQNRQFYQSIDCHNAQDRKIFFGILDIFLQTKPVKF